MEPGLAFCDGSTAMFIEEGGAARLLRLPMELRSFPRPPSDNGSEQGLRNGDLLSLSLQKTTAIEPPTTELPAPPLGPPVPNKSMPSFPEEPVVLLTPSRTSTETLDWSLPFRLVVLSFLDFPERLNSFRLPLSRFLSFTLCVRFITGSPDETGAQPDAADKDARFLLLVLVDSEFFFTDFLLI